jgi:hypothetical protein
MSNLAQIPIFSKFNFKKKKNWQLKNESIFLPIRLSMWLNITVKMKGNAVPAHAFKA